MMKNVKRTRLGFLLAFCAAFGLFTIHTIASNPPGISRAEAEETKAALEYEDLGNGIVVFSSFKNPRIPVEKRLSLYMDDHKDLEPLSISVVDYYGGDKLFAVFRPKQCH